MSEQKTRVLMVDDEPNVLAGYRRSIGRRYDLVTAIGAQEALEILEKWPPFSVIITDMRMPEINGLEFIKRARRIHPKTVYMMLTGNADQDTAISAINEGQIFRFLNKPCESETIVAAIRAAKAQYDLIHAEAELLNKTLSGSVKLLVEAMMISDPVAAEAIRSVRENAARICEAVGFSAEWRYPIAASLFLIGSITVPRSSGEELFQEHYLGKCAKAGSKLLRHIPRLEEVAQIILAQRQHQPLPEQLANPDAAQRVVIGSQIIRLAFDWYAASRLGAACSQSIIESLSIGKQHDDRLLAAVQDACEADKTANSKSVQHKRLVLQASQLRPGVIADADIEVSDQRVIATRGQVLTQMLIDRLSGFVEAGLLADTFAVIVHEALHEGDLGQAA